MTFTERRQRVTDTDSPLLLLEITSPAFTGPLRAVADTQNWISQGVEYIGVPFGFQLPDDVPGQPARAVLEIANAGTGMTDELEQWTPGTPVSAILRVTDRANPDVIEREFHLPIQSVSVSNGVVTARLGGDTSERQQAVRIRFTPFLTPGVFA